MHAVVPRSLFVLTSLLASGPLRAAPAVTSQVTWFVDASAPSGGNGSSRNPFQTIQEGVDAAAAASGDTVLVLPGTYAENVDFLNKQITVVSEAGPGVTVIDAGQNGPAVRIPGPIDWGNTVRLAGFTLTNGSGEDYSFIGPVGGGLVILDNSPLVEQCVITGNQADQRGGGVFADNSAALIRDCTIASNTGAIGCSFGDGGGVYAPTSVVLERCDIRSNFAVVWGGGTNGTTLIDCSVEDNYASYGGGIVFASATDCRIFDNIADSCDSSLEFGGGAADSTLLRCVIEKNHTNTWGGGAANSTLTQCVVRRNTVSFNYDLTGSKGGGVYNCDLTECAVYQNVLQLGVAQHLPASRGGGAYGGNATRTAIYENSADFGGGAHESGLEHAAVFNNVGGGVRGSTTVHNSVVFSNAGPQVAASTNVTYSNVENGHAGTGNIDVPPMFWAPFGSPSGKGHDFHLKPGSPCIDAGDPASPLDPDGSRADIGVYPWVPWCVEPIAYCHPKVNSQGCVPEISHVGAPSLSKGGLQVTASNVLNNKTGLLFWGGEPLSSPFQGGTKCVGAPTVRTLLQGSAGNPPPNDCSGMYSFTFHGAYMSSRGLVAGSEVHAQYWSRDPESPSTTGLTDALWFIVCP